MDAAEKAADELYGLPLGDFVARRDERARALRQEGDRDAAGRVAALRKPTVAAWAANQLARRERDGVRALLAAGAGLRDAHADLLGGGAPDAVRQATDAEREALDRLTEAAGRILAEGERSASDPSLARVRETLHAAAVDEELGELLRAGRLVEDHRAAGLGFGLAAAGAAEPRPKRKPAARREEREPARLRKARERRAEAEERLADARAAAGAAERAAAEHARALERAERELAARRRDVERAERELERARTAVERAS